MINLSLHVFSVLSLFAVAAASAQKPAITAQSYAIADATTGVLLESEDGSRKVQVASLTKVATAMVVLDWAELKSVDLGTMAVVPESAAALSSPQGVGFMPGAECSLRDLLAAAMMQSDNQAALTLAVHVGRDLSSKVEMSPTDRFVAQMNALARRLGMERTRFTNPHGLDRDEKPVPYSTAEDLAKLAAYAMKNSAVLFYSSQKERKIKVTNPGDPAPFEYLLRNTNELLGTDNIDGLKTGTTAKAGECLMLTAAQRPETKVEGDTHISTPRRLVVVLLGSTNRFPEGEQLLKRGWALYDQWAAAGRPLKGWKPGKRAKS